MLVNANSCLALYSVRGGCESHSRYLLLGREAQVEEHGRGHDQDVGGDTVTRHAVLADLDGLVHAEALFL